MEEKRIGIAQQRDNETNILDCIVDAMLAVETDLRTATVAEWAQTLVESCRRQKRLYADQRISMASKC
jgi:hypothetical protein